MSRKYPINPTPTDIAHARSLLAAPDLLVTWFANPEDPQAIYEIRIHGGLETRHYTEGGTCPADVLLAMFGHVTDLHQSLAPDVISGDIEQFTALDGRLWGCYVAHRGNDEPEIAALRQQMRLAKGNV